MSQFGSTKQGNPQVCAHCEALLMDVLDRTATPEDQAFFDKHIASCTECSRMFMDAKRGGAWMEMLRNPRPEPSADLFSRIIAQTSGLQAAEDPAGTAAAPAGQASAPALGEFIPVPMPPVAPSPYLYHRPVRPLDLPGSNVLPFRVRAAAHSFANTMLQPRLAMTAAMAFFSIALTLNLTGVHLSALTAEDLKPSAIRKNFNETTAHVVRYCDNLRVVYELEARAHDLRSEDPPAPAPDKPAEPKSRPDDKPDEKKARPKPGPGTSRREPLFRDDRYRAAAPLPNPSPADRNPLYAVTLSPAFHIIPKGDLA